MAIYGGEIVIPPESEADECISQPTVNKVNRYKYVNCLGLTLYTRPEGSGAVFTFFKEEAGPISDKRAAELKEFHPTLEKF